MGEQRDLMDWFAKPTSKRPTPIRLAIPPLWISGLLPFGFGSL